MRAGTHGETRADALLALQDDGIVEPTDAGPTTVPRRPPGGCARPQPRDARRVGRGRRRSPPSSSATSSSTPPRSRHPSIDNGDLDPVALEATRRALLAPVRPRTTPSLVGPLFAAPGGGQVRPDGDTWRLEPI